VNAVAFAVAGGERPLASLCEELGAEPGRVEIRAFPDGETYVRIATPVADRPVLIVCGLDRPDAKLLPLYFLATAARQQGARSVGLVAPYLAYMRQDRQFQPGEAVTSDAFGQLLSTFLDWLVTVDPHLHRHASLAEVYRIPTRVLHAAPAIAQWIRRNVAKPLLIGPDGESRQWVEAIASEAGAPWVVLEKTRHGDRDVELSLPPLDVWLDRTPVLIDDIVSTARTMGETVRQLRRLGFSAPICVGVHAIFAAGAEAELRDAGAQQIVTCDSVEHASNAIPLGRILAGGVRSLLAG
jgi:ribose-phosphate pyrophosphokinase